MRAELQRPHAQTYIEPKDKNAQLAIVDRKFFVGFKKKHTRFLNKKPKILIGS